MNDVHNIKKTINKVIRDKGRFPSLQEMCNMLSFSSEQVYKYMTALEEDGYLEKVGGWYRFPIEKKEEIKIHDPLVDKDIYMNIPIEEIESNQGITKPYLKKSNKKLKINQSIYGMPIYVIQFLMGVIGIGACIISIYYTTVWLLEFLPWAFALLLSSIMVGFAVSAFEAIILFLSGQVTRSKVSKITITAGFIILWIVVTFFSIFSTIAGQYNKFVFNLQQQTRQGIDSGGMDWSLLQEKKIDLRKRLGEYREQITTLNKITSGMDTVESRTENNELWKETQYRIRKGNEEINKITEELNKVREDEQRQLKENKEKGILFGTKGEKKIPNFYGWIAKIFNIDTDLAQFFMSLLPAIFVDIIAPVGVAISLFLRNKYKN